MVSELIEQQSKDEYKVKTSEMSPGQKVACPDNTTEIEKIDDDTVKLICKKGTCQKLKASSQ